MSMPKNAAHNHIEQIYRLVGLLQQRCPDRFDHEIEEVIDDVLDSFDQFQATKSPSDDPHENLYDDSLSRNYITAQCTLFLVFINKVDQLTIGTPSPIRMELDQLWKNLQIQYQHFFAKEAPHLGEKNA